jgi:quercetin dioxygenase-like cupin family protein
MIRPAISCALASLALFFSACGKDEPKDASKDDMKKMDAGASMPSSETALLKPDDMKWMDGPPSLPPGAKIAVLEGIPSKPGAFTVRFKFPAGYKIPPHTHPADEHVTLLDGSLSLGMGATWNDGALKELPVGGFGVMAKGMHHYAFSASGATLQLHGIGPWDITYVNASDDPRKKK